MAVDYAALAKQYGGTTEPAPSGAPASPSVAPSSTSGSVDYAALAKQYGGSSQPAAVSPSPTQTTPAPAAPTGFWGKIASGAKAVGSFLTSNEQNFGQDAAAAIGGGAAIDKASNLDKLQSDSDVAFLKAMRARQAAGTPLTDNQQRLWDEIATRTGQSKATPFETASQQLPALKKSNTQVLGDAAGVGLDIATVGSLAKGAQSFKPIAAAKNSLNLPLTATEAITKNIAGKAPTTATKLVGVAKQYLKSAGKYGAIGYGYDVANKLQEGKTGAEAATPGAGTALGVALPVLPALARTVGTLAPAAAPRIVNSLVKPLLKDFSYGKNPGRAIAQEGITGNSLDQLAQNIGARRAEIGQDIGSLSSRLDATASTAASAAGRQTRGLQLGDSLKPIDDAMQTAAKTNNPTLLSRLQQVKDALVHDLTLGKDESGAPTIIKGEARDLSNVSFQDAFKLKSSIGDMTRWTGNKSDDEAVNGALKKVYGAVKENIGQTADKVDPAAAAKLKTLNEKYADLVSAEVATKYRDKINARQNLISAPIKAGAIAGLLAAPFTGGLSLTTALVGLGAAGVDKALGSTAVKTRVASWLAKESPSKLEEFYAQHPEIANVIYKTFSQEHNGPSQKLGDYLKGAQPGLSMKNVTAADIHPDDLYLMHQFIDHARIKAPLSEEQFAQAEIIAQHFGISMDKGLNGVANSFEKVLNGQLPGKSTVVQGRDTVGRYASKK